MLIAPIALEIPLNIDGASANMDLKPSIHMSFKFPYTFSSHTRIQKLSDLESIMYMIF